MSFTSVIAKGERQITSCSSLETVASSVCRINRTDTTLHPCDSESKEFRSLVSRVIKKPARPAQTDNEEGTGLEVQQPFLPLIPCRPFRRFRRPAPNGFPSSSNCSLRACRREEKTETERQKGKEGRKKKRKY